MRRTILALAAFALLLTGCDGDATGSAARGSASPSSPTSPSASASEDAPGTLPESMVGTWTGITTNYPPGRLDHWASVLEFTPCSLVPDEVCGSYVSCSSDYIPGRVVTGEEGSVPAKPIELAFLRTEGPFFVFYSPPYEDLYVIPLASGDTLASEAVLRITSLAGTWDTYTLWRRVGTPGAAKPFPEWRDIVESGKTCPSAE